MDLKAAAPERGCGLDQIDWGSHEAQREHYGWDALDRPGRTRVQLRLLPRGETVQRRACVLPSDPLSLLITNDFAYTHRFIW